MLNKKTSHRVQVVALVVMVAAIFWIAPHSFADNKSSEQQDQLQKFTDQVYKLYDESGKMRVSFQRHPSLFAVENKEHQKLLRQSQQQKLKVYIEAHPFDLKILKVTLLK